MILDAMMLRWRLSNYDVYCALNVCLIWSGVSKVGPIQWRHNGRDSISNHQPHHCLLNRSFRCRSKKTSKLRVTGLCAGNSPVTINAENVSIWWRHHVIKAANIMIRSRYDNIPWASYVGYTMLLRIVFVLSLGTIIQYVTSCVALKEL